MEATREIDQDQMLASDVEKKDILLAIAIRKILENSEEEAEIIEIEIAQGQEIILTDSPISLETKEGEMMANNAVVENREVAVIAINNVTMLAATVATGDKKEKGLETVKITAAEITEDEKTVAVKIMGNATENRSSVVIEIEACAEIEMIGEDLTKEESMAVIQDEKTEEIEATEGTEGKEAVAEEAVAALAAMAGTDPLILNGLVDRADSEDKAKAQETGEEKHNIFICCMNVIE